MLLSLNFEGPLCAPMRVAERESWWVDYWKDHEVEESNPVASGEDLGVGEDTCAEAARDRGNIPLPRFACRGALGDKSDGEHGEAELRVQGHEA